MVKTDNRTQGGKFEQELSRILSENGFWVHVMQQNKSGQPADIVAIKGKYHTLIDCKLVSDEKGFKFDRIEENQKYAMRMFKRKAYELCYFALKLPDGNIHMVNIERLEILRSRGRKRLTDKEIREQWLLEKWIKASDTWAEDV